MDEERAAGPGSTDVPSDASYELFQDSGAYVLPSTPSRERRRVPETQDRGIRTTTSMSWLVGLLAFLLLTTHLVPLAVERIRFAWVRGQQRAEYEVAGDVLNKVRFGDLPQVFQLVSQRVSPTVVHISCDSSFANGAGPALGGGFRFRNSDQGSGVIIDPNGYIVTNQHVVSNADRINVRLSDGRHFRAELVGQDDLTDIAVLKIDANNLMCAEWGDSDSLSVGSMVWAVGSPFGLENSITFGILSAKHRAGRIGRVHQDLMQTDAAVNPGNSGGPLVDVKGRIVGINTAIMGDAYQGVSFAIPSNVVRQVFEQIKERGAVSRGWLGVQPADVDDVVAERLGLESEEGALVTVVVGDQGGKTSPARSAGIRVDDVIIRWGDGPIRSAADLFSAVAASKPGDEVDVTIIRQGEELVLPVVVGRRERP